MEIFLLNILPVKKIGCIFAHNKRTFKKHFPLFGYSILTTITLPLHTPLPKEIHSLICLCHANNKQTHNYGKPIFTLLQMKIINSKEINAISRLSGYKKLNGCTWLKNTHHML